MEIISNSVDRLSNSLRLFGEEQLKFSHLMELDQEEAVNNLDRSFEAILESFHSLYDVFHNKYDFDYFKYADTALLIMLRNAIHHRNHLLFKSWNKEMYLNSGFERMHGAEFLFISYDTCEESIFKPKFHYKLIDIYERLKSPQMHRYAEQHKQLFEEELLFSKIMEQAKENRYPEKQIYINIMPILISAMGKVFTSLKNNNIQVEGYDSDVYFEHFTSQQIVCLDKPIASKLRV